MSLWSSCFSLFGGFTPHFSQLLRFRSPSFCCRFLQMNSPFILLSRFLTCPRYLLSSLSPSPSLKRFTFVWHRTSLRRGLIQQNAQSSTIQNLKLLLCKSSASCTGAASPPFWSNALLVWARKISIVSQTLPRTSLRERNSHMLLITCIHFSQCGN